MYTGRDEHEGLSHTGAHAERHSKAIHLTVIGCQNRMHDPSEVCACDAFLSLISCWGGGVLSFPFT